MEYIIPDNITVSDTIPFDHCINILWTYIIGYLFNESLADLEKMCTQLIDISSLVHKKVHTVILISAHKSMPSRTRKTI